MSNKNVYIIAGPNGSGKTTFAKTFLPDYAKCERFINADLIAAGLSPFSPQQVAIKAGKLVLSQIDEYVKAGVDFGFETTMSGVTYIRLIKSLKEKGYKVHVFFLWIPSDKLAIVRVKDRVAQGGHNVPVEDIKRRFKRSVRMFFKEYVRLTEKWMLFDNSGSKPNIIAKKINTHIDIEDKEKYDLIRKSIGANV